MDPYRLLQQYLLPYSRYADDQLSFSRRGWADANIPASPKVDPFIYGGRRPDLTDEEIVNAIRTRDVAISPSRPNFGFTAPRPELHDDLRQMMALGPQTDNGRGFAGNDISLTGTQWELTPEQMLELRARDEAKRAAAAAAPQYGPLGPRPPAGPSNDPLTVLLRYLGAR